MLRDVALVAGTHVENVAKVTESGITITGSARTHTNFGWKSY